MFHYEVTVKFDDSIAPVPEQRAYFSCQDKHEAIGIGHAAEGTSTMLFFSTDPVSKEALQRELGDLEIMAFTEVERAV
mgnify:CR=1 FL=1